LRHEILLALIPVTMMMPFTCFLIKLKSHRGEPINERADTLAEEGREISDDKRWDDRTDRMTFEVRKGNTTVRSVWRNRGRRRSSLTAASRPMPAWRWRTSCTRASTRLCSGAGRSRERGPPTCQNCCLISKSVKHNLLQRWRKSVGDKKPRH
jgi:hypothetical protein